MNAKLITLHIAPLAVNHRLCNTFGNGWYKTYTGKDNGTDDWRAVSHSWTWRAAVSPCGTKIVYGQVQNYYLSMNLHTVNPDGLILAYVRQAADYTYPGSGPVEKVLAVTPITIP